MDWIKVLNKHILYEYTDLKDSEFAAWIRIMALTAAIEKEPTREQMLKYVHYKTLDSLQRKLNTHSIDLQYIINKVLMDVQYVVNRRTALKNNTQRYRERNKPVINDVMITSQIREDKIREDKNKHIEISIPEWIKKETWDAFMEVRKKLKAPQTDTAIKLIISKLAKLKSSGQDPNETINESIQNGWKGVFPLKAMGGNNRKTFTPPPGERDVREYQPEEIPAVSEEERKRNIEIIKRFTNSIGRASP